MKEKMNSFNIKELPGQIKERLDKLDAKLKKLMIFGGIGIIALAVIIAVVLNHKEYAVLYSGVNQDEAAQIVALLQESGVDYQYKTNGDIMVDKQVEDQTRAQLAMDGYPKSGFAYNTYITNAGGMTTDTEKETYKLYELQDRIGATIRLFDGVKDAKVTIALGQKQKYVLEEDADQNTASASVVVTMLDGGSPSEEQAKAIQLLVARSVTEMLPENVSVFDGNGIDITEKANSGEGTDSESLARIVENQIVRNVMNVLGPIYGTDNVRVSAKSRINMEKLIRESITYTTPDKIDETDKTGIVSHEETSEESGNGAGTGGITGTETNADATQYNAVNGGEGVNTYTSMDATRDYLVNQIKEQGQIDPGVLEDLTVAVAINGETTGSLSQTQLKELVGNAAGMPTEDQETKITVVNAPFYESVAAEKPGTGLLAQLTILFEGNPYLLYIMGGVIVFLLLLLLVIILVARRRRRKRKKAEEEAALQAQVQTPVPDLSFNPEIIKLQNEKTKGLREEVREFTDQNPEISAQLLKAWLNGGEVHGDGNE